MYKEKIKHKISLKKRLNFKSDFWDVLNYPFTRFLISIVLVCYCFVFIKAFINHQFHIPLTIISLLCGVFYQSYQIIRNKEKILIYSILSLFLSALSFISIQSNSSNPLIIWVYFYLGAYLIVFSLEHHQSLTTPFGEGISFLFAFGICYWFFEKQMLGVDTVLSTFITIILLIFLLYSILHAFFEIKHHHLSRFLLSFFTCCSILILSIDQIIELYSQGDITSEHRWVERLILLFRYFLLGLSSLYVFQNLMLLLSYLPNKYTRSYFSDVKQNTLIHIKRFSEDQISKTEACFALIFTVSVYSLNYIYQIIPINMSIWLSILLVPLVIQSFFHHKIDHSLTAAKLHASSSHKQISINSRIKNRKKRKRRKKSKSNKK